MRKETLGKIVTVWPNCCLSEKTWRMTSESPLFCPYQTNRDSLFQTHFLFWKDCLDQMKVLFVVSREQETITCGILAWVKNIIIWTLFQTADWAKDCLMAYCVVTYLHWVVCKTGFKTVLYLTGSQCWEYWSNSYFFFITTSVAPQCIMVYKEPTTEIVCSWNFNTDWTMTAKFLDCVWRLAVTVCKSYSLWC